MKSMRDMAEAYRDAAARLEKRVGERQKAGADASELASLRTALREIRMVQRTLERYYTAPRPAAIASAGRRISCGRDAAMDLRQYRNWARSSTSDEQEDGSRQALLRAVQQSEGVLSDPQQETWRLWKDGGTGRDIARQRNVSPSAVSRTLAAARQRVREEAERTVCADAVQLDLADPETARLVLSAVTAKQAAYLYLYFAEWLSLREIARLVHADHASVSRTIRRALRNISRGLGCREADLLHMDALDELAYTVYRAIPDGDELLPPEYRPRPAAKPSAPSGTRQKRAAPEPLPLLTIHVSGGCWDPCGGKTGRGPVCRGRLLEALLKRARRSAGSFRGWLFAVFRRLAGRRNRPMRWKWNHLKRNKEDNRI